MMNSINQTATGWMWTKDWNEKDDSEMRIIWYRKEMMSKELPENGQLTISADTRYKIFVNGRFVQEGPQKGSPDTWFEDGLDFSEFLDEERLIIAVEVLRLPLNPMKGNQSLYRTFCPGLYIGGIDASNFVCRVIREISLHRVTYTYDPIQMMETVNLPESLAGWKFPGYTTSGWNPVYLYPRLLGTQAPGYRVLRTIPPMRHAQCSFTSVVCQRDSEGQIQNVDLKPWEDMISGRHAIEIPAHTTRLVEISAGEEMCGYLRLAMVGGTGTSVFMLSSECYEKEHKPHQRGDDDLSAVSTKSDRTDFQNMHLHGEADRYHVCGYGNKETPEIYEPYWFRTFRFVQLAVTTEEQPLTILHFDYISTGYPLVIRTNVKTDDLTFAGIWDISQRTLARCMHETYVDCPYYEQLAYAMDSRQEILYTYAISADDRLARQTMDAFRRSQRPDGMITSCAPSIVDNVIPGFSIYYILMIYDHMMYFGDRELVKEHFPAVFSVLEFFRRNLTDHGLVGHVGGMNGRDHYWSFIDWTAEWNERTGVPVSADQGEGSITMESLLYLYGLEHAVKLAEFLGWSELKTTYLEQAAHLKAAIRTYCMGQQDGAALIQDGPGLNVYSTHCQVFGILCDIFANDEGSKALSATYGKKGIPQCSCAFAFYLFRAFEQLDQYDKANQVWNLWRRMLDNHLTTTVENSTNERSDCHGWSAGILYELPAVYLGVKPLEPGFAKVQIVPRPGHLKRAAGDVITPRGMIHVEWERREDGTMQLFYTAPDDIKVVTSVTA